MQPKSWLFQLLFAAPHVILLCPEAQKAAELNRFGLSLSDV